MTGEDQRRDFVLSEGISSTHLCLLAPFVPLRALIAFGLRRRATDRGRCRKGLRRQFPLLQRCPIWRRRSRLGTWRSSRLPIPILRIGIRFLLLFLLFLFLLFFLLFLFFLL